MFTATSKANISSVILIKLLLFSYWWGYAVVGRPMLPSTSAQLGAGDHGYSATNYSTGSLTPAAMTSRGRDRMSNASSHHAARLGVNHVWDAHSPLRPAGCDDACASRLRLQRYGEARASRRERVQRAAAAAAAAANNKVTNVSTSSSTTRKVNRSDSELVHVHELASIPWGQVSTGYYSGGQFSEYYVQLTVSDTSQPVLLLLDSGSDLLWFQCQPCTNCYPQYFTVFDPAQSSTHSRTNNADPYCGDVQQVPELGQGADENQCLYGTSYEDGTTSAGYIAKDEFNFWDAGSGSGEDVTVTIGGVGFGCGTNNAVGAGVQTVVSGVLGLGHGRDLSLPEQLNIAYDYSHAFAFCLAPIFSNPYSGWITFGDGALPPSNYASTHLVTDAGFQVYTYVEVVDFLINNQPVGVPTGVLSTINSDNTGGVIVDCGDMLSIITPDAYNPFRAAWLTAVANILGDPGQPGPEGLDACWDYPNDINNLPTIGFLFADNNVLTLAPSATQLVFNDDNGVRRMCWPFVQDQGGETFANMVIGAVSLHGLEVVIDIQNSVFSWSPDYPCG